MNVKIDIVNTTNRMRTFRLPHQIVCVRAGVCLCKNGRQSAIHIAPYQTARNHPREVLLAQDLVDAMAAPASVTIKESKVIPVDPPKESEDDPDNDDDAGSDDDPGDEDAGEETSEETEPSGDTQKEITTGSNRKRKRKR